MSSNRSIVLLLVLVAITMPAQAASPLTSISSPSLSSPLLHLRAALARAVPPVVSDLFAPDSLTEDRHHADIRTQAVCGDPGVFCPVPNPTANISCFPGFYCPADTPAEFCPRGFYCPNPVTRIECPEKYYCPRGSQSPRECSVFAFCPKGSWRYTYWIGIVYLIVILPVMFSLNWLYQRKMQQLRERDESLARSHRASVEMRTAQSKYKVPVMNVRFENIKVVVQVDKQPKTIMEDVSGEFRAGTVTAVLGPSGAGKTTLISAVTGKVPLAGGVVRVNGVQDDPARYRSVVGFVPQDDVMIRTLTVRDVLTHSAYARLPADMPREEKEGRVDQVLALLNLTAVQNWVIGDENTRGINRGERKRVNIGIELVAQPSIIFLDEPTTGLDSTTSIDVMNVVRNIAQSGVTVVCVVHQPRYEIFDCFDNVLLLAPGGKTVYFGRAPGTLKHLQDTGFDIPPNVNPADWILDVTQGVQASREEIAAGGSNAGNPASVKVEGDADEVDESSERALVPRAVRKRRQDYLTLAWRAREKELLPNEAASQEDAAAQKALVSAASRSQISIFYQIYLYTFRGLLQQLRILPGITLELTLHIVCGLILGIAFINDNYFLPPIPPSYVPFCPEPLREQLSKEPVKELIILMITFTVMALGLTAGSIGFRNFGAERVNWMREHETGLSTGAYVIGKSLCEIPIIVLYTFTFCLTFATMAYPASKFGDYFAASFLFECMVFGVGYSASVLLPSATNALLLITTSTLLNGLTTTGQNVQNVIGWGYWYAEPLFIAEMRLDIQPEATKQFIKIFAEGKEALNFDLSAYNSRMGVMVLYAVALRVLTYAIWKYRLRSK